MRNFYQNGDSIDAVAPVGGVISGQGLLIGGLFGVAATDAAEGAKFAFHLVGCFHLPKATGNGLTQGQKVYWDDVAKKITGTATSNTLIGHAVEAAASGATEAIARLSN